MKQDYSFLMENIPYGKENAVSADQLAKRLKTDERSVRMLIHGARASGLLILSGVPGYWRSNNLPELRAFYKRMKNQGVGTMVAAESARLKIKELEGDGGNEQYSLFE